MADIEIKNETKQDNDGMTLLAYRMQKAEEAIKEGFKEQAQQIERLTAGFVAKELFDEAKRQAKEEHDDIHKRIDNLADNQTWVVRTIIGAIFAGGIGLLFALI